MGDFSADIPAYGRCQSGYRWTSVSITAAALLYTDIGTESLFLERKRGSNALGLLICMSKLSWRPCSFSRQDRHIASINLYRAYHTPAFCLARYLLVWAEHGVQTHHALLSNLDLMSTPPNPTKATRNPDCEFPMRLGIFPSWNTNGVCGISPV